MTTMKPFGKKKNIFYCQHCKTQYKQHINGKIVYIPLHVADLLEQTIKDHYKNNPDAEPEAELNFSIDFEPDIDFDPDETT
jgi:hypothetical protein|tara:strand:+ start:3357 stop:3599 length:243 start_codon:yes stop_codon:yes gene_type:complete